MAIIGLLTDFGLQDEYVGLMKAVILRIDPAATIVDISHAVDPQDIAQAAFLLESSFRYFPPGSIHVVVVDPGVGTPRALLCLEANDQRFLAPDNGVLSLLMESPGRVRLRRIEFSAGRSPDASPTFHGREILAPAAAHLSLGRDASELGPELIPAAMTIRTDLRAHPSPDGGMIGRIVHVDRFGNLITNIAAADLTPVAPHALERRLAVRLSAQVIVGLHRTYADVAAGRPLALVGSRGYLEVAVNRGNAQRFFGVGKGDAVEVRPVT